MLCLQQRRDATCRTTPANLNLQVDLEAIFTSLYTPFTSPPKLPHPRYTRPTAASVSSEKWDEPQIAHARKSAAIWGPSPLVFINMQVSEVLAMC